MPKIPDIGLKSTQLNFSVLPKIPRLFIAKKFVVRLDKLNLQFVGSRNLFFQCQRSVSSRKLTFYSLNNSFNCRSSPKPIALQLKFSQLNSISSFLNFPAQINRCGSVPEIDLLPVLYSSQLFLQSFESVPEKLTKSSNSSVGTKKSDVDSPKSYFLQSLMFPQ